eukprot:1185046-Prorocentrum_minimum.AAC.7
MARLRAQHPGSAPMLRFDQLNRRYGRKITSGEGRWDKCDIAVTPSVVGLSRGVAARAPPAPAPASAASSPTPARCLSSPVASSLVPGAARQQVAPEQGTGGPSIWGTGGAGSCVRDGSGRRLAGIGLGGGVEGSLRSGWRLLTPPRRLAPSSLNPRVSASSPECASRCAKRAVMFVRLLKDLACARLPSLCIGPNLVLASPNGQLRTSCPVWKL